MKTIIQNIDLVSDGLMITFDDATTCYYPAEMLRALAGQPSTQIFLTQDPSPEILEPASHMDAPAELMAIM